MSTWTNEFDVFRDLDRLSGLRQSNVTYPALNAFGRGKLVVKEDKNGRITKVAQFLPPPKIPVADSCPDLDADNKMQDDTTWERDRDLYMQLRQVCGRGYSNELIEEEFGQTEWHSQEKLNGISRDPVVEDMLVEESNKLSLSDPGHTTLTLNKSTSPLLQPSSAELVPPDAKKSQARLFVHPPKLKPSRNALLNSLARRKILQLPEEPKTTVSSFTCSERGIGHTAEDVISNDKFLPDAKLLGGEFVTEPSHSASRKKLAAPNVDSQKMGLESVYLYDQAQSFGEAQKQCINWSDIRKRKASSYSAVSMYADDSPRSSPVHAVNYHTSQMSKQDSKVKSIPATSISELPGLSASPNSLREETDTSDWKQDDIKKQDLSLGLQYKAKTKGAKQYRSSLLSSPTNYVTPGEQLSWCSLRQHTSHPKHVKLSDYIDARCSFGSVPTQVFSEGSCSLQEELTNCNELKIHSDKDFPPLE